MIPFSYTSYSADSAISLSISALALANLSKDSARPEGYPDDLQSMTSCLAWDSYGRAMYLLNKDLRAANHQSLEQPLFVIWMLGLFEMIDSRGGLGPGGSWTVHVKGASALIRSRSYLNNDSEMSYVMIDQVFVQILFINLLSFERPDLPLDIFVARGEHGSPSTNLVYKMYRAAEICSNLANSVHKMQHISSKALSARLWLLIRMGFALDDDLQQCTRKFPFLKSGEVISNKGRQVGRLRSAEETDLSQSRKLRGEEKEDQKRNIHGSPRDMITLSIYLSLRLQLQYMLQKAITALSNSSFQLDYEFSSLKEEANAPQEDLLGGLCDIAQNICLAAGMILDSGIAEILKGMYTLYPLRVFELVVKGNRDIMDLLEKEQPGITQWGSQLLRISRMKVSKRYAERQR